MPNSSSSQPSIEVNPKGFWIIFVLLTCNPLLWCQWVFYKLKSFHTKPAIPFSPLLPMILVFIVIISLLVATTYLYIQMPVKPDTPLLPPSEFQTRIILTVTILTQLLCCSGVLFFSATHNWHYYAICGTASFLYNLAIIAPRASKYWREYEKQGIEVEKNLLPNDKA